MSVCLSIATARKDCLSDFYENFAKDVSVDEEELLKFWKSSTSGSQCLENLNS